jgi:hypothetical protein
LNSRPNGVNSGKTVWQAAQAIPVWRAKLGTAQPRVAPQSSSASVKSRKQPWAVARASPLNLPCIPTPSILKLRGFYETLPAISVRETRRSVRITRNGARVPGQTRYHLAVFAHGARGRFIANWIREFFNALASGERP